MLRFIYNVYSLWSTKGQVYYLFSSQYNLILIFPYSQECNPDKDAWLVMLPMYLSMYIPMVFVMVANPILYWHSSKKGKRMEL